MALTKDMAWALSDATEVSVKKLQEVLLSEDAERVKAGWLLRAQEIYQADVSTLLRVAGEAGKAQEVSSLANMNLEALLNEQGLAAVAEAICHVSEMTDTIETGRHSSDPATAFVKKHPSEIFRRIVNEDAVTGYANGRALLDTKALEAARLGRTIEAHEAMPNTGWFAAGLSHSNKPNLRAGNK